MTLLEHSHFYLVGIKGVAMTSIAQCLIDANKTISGCDVSQDFVTKNILDTMGCTNSTLDIDFLHTLPKITDCLIYTSAHGGVDNALVQQAVQAGIPVYSQAQALGALFNQKQGIAVCGVGGKSSVSAMIAWILQKTAEKNGTEQPSFSVGVGNIPGLNKTGQWNSESNIFVSEADEYVTDPAAPQKGIPITPRFSYLNPAVTVCTNLAFDHPDVYRDFAHTKTVFEQFFGQIKENGMLIINQDNPALLALSQKVQETHTSLKIVSFGERKDATFQLSKYSFENGKSSGTLLHHTKSKSEPKTHIHTIALSIPGKFNILNATSAIAACYSVGVSLEDSITALTEFKSTMRRFEYVGAKNGVEYYDDYAHHPNEVEAAITAFIEWYPQKRKIFAFQSHTYSRTKKLFADFIDAFADAKEVVMIDIFSSAREEKDTSVSSDILCSEISKKYPHIQAVNLKTIDALADYLQNNLKPGDACLTIGAGDIYEVHEKISN